jgi:hypothetical protein
VFASCFANPRGCEPRKTRPQVAVPSALDTASSMTKRYVFHTPPWNRLPVGIKSMAFDEVAVLERLIQRATRIVVVAKVAADESRRRKIR